jgi:hypothetical protein
MKKVLLLLLILSICTISALSQNVMFSVDNGQIGGYYSTPQINNWEETCFLRPPGPGYIDTIFVYLGGDTPALDTIWIVGDPVDGGYPPTMYSRYFSSYAGFTINYQQPGFIALPVDPIRFDGLSGIAVQHLIKSSGPYFAVDNNGNNPRNSWLNDVFTGNPNFYNLRGTIMSPAEGNYIIRASVRYDFPQGETSQPPPDPVLVDVTADAGLIDGEGNPVSSRYVTVTDWNQDGFDDLAIGNKFYENKGDGTFENVSGRIKIDGGTTVWADIDNDGYMDCFNVRGNGNDKIYYGDAEGGMTEDTDPTVVFDAPTRTPLFLDIDKDGDLDLYIAFARKTVDGSEVYFPDKLFKNMGDRKFEDITDAGGIAAGEPAPYYDCYGANVVDYNNDGWPDIFVANYRTSPDRLYENQKDGTFKEVSALVGVRGIAGAFQGYFGNDMGSDWADFDNDGDMDLAAGTLAHPDERALVMTPSFICRNGGEAEGYKFTEVGQEMGLAFKEMNSGIMWVDLNDDGYQDLVHCHYSYDRFEETSLKRFTRIYINSGDEGNYKLVDRTWEFGARVHGAWSPAMIDYDNDGDMDLILASDRERLYLFRNDINDKGNWISFRVRGKAASGVNNDALGSVVKVFAGENVYMRQWNCSATALSSQKTGELHFGLGDAESVDKVEIIFSDGKLISMSAPEINKKYIVNYDDQSSVNEELLDEFDISEISPNPASTTAKLTYSNLMGEALQFDLYDSRGELVRKLPVKHDAGTGFELNINAEGLNSGSYVLKISSGSKIAIRKLLIIK